MRARIKKQKRQIISRIFRWPFRKSNILLCIYLLAVGFAELLLALADPWIGLALHALLLLALTLHAGLGHQVASRRLARALTLVPLLRILSLVLPLAQLPRYAWYPVVLVPLLIAVWMIMRQLRISRVLIGLRSGNVLLQLLLMGGGLGVGAAEYALLGAPQPLVPLAWNVPNLIVLVSLIFAGVVEELIFRGLLQTVASPALGHAAPIYVALLFMALQFGYLSAPLIVFALGIGLIFAYAARWSGSIVGVGLAHGLANVTLFIVMPFLAQQAPSSTTSMLRSAIAAGTTLALGALAILVIHARLLRRAARLLRQLTPRRPSTWQIPRPPSHRPAKRLLSRPTPRRPSPPDLTQAASMIRRLRRIAGLTYGELSERTDLPDSLLAEIERGQKPPKKEQLGRIFQALGVKME